MKAPNCCPICGESDGWVLIESSKKGFNSKKAVLGGVLLGVVGIAAGIGGKKKSLYICRKCGFSHEYDGNIADKDKNAGFPPKGYKKGGMTSVYVDIIKSATPYCVFCGTPQNLYAKQDGTNIRFLCENCHAEFRCEFTFWNNKIKSKSTQILNCGNINENNLVDGSCEASILIKDPSKID